MLRVTLTIYPSRSTVEPVDPPDRPALIVRVLDELSGHGPKEAFRHMRKWPSGRLSLVHLNVLMTLDTDGELPMGALADALDVSQASITGIIDRMEQRGIVERRRDDGDRRVVRVAMTDEGRRLIGLVDAQRREHMAQLLLELDDRELEGFLAGLSALRRARERIAAPTAPTAPAGAPA